MNRTTSKSDGALPVVTYQAGGVPGPLPRRGPDQATCRHIASSSSSSSSSPSLSSSSSLSPSSPPPSSSSSSSTAEKGFVCGGCFERYETVRGMRIHQGKKCMKKLMPCRSSDRETRSKSSQDKNHIGANHSGSIVAVADTTSVGQEVRDH